MHVRVGGFSKFINSESYSLPLERVSSRPVAQRYKTEQRSRISRRERASGSILLPQ